MDPATPSTTCMLWKLPPEVRDIIYDLSYGRSGEVKVQFRRDWELDQKIERRRSKQRGLPKRFPESPLGEMACSRQYLTEAARTYAKTNRFIFHNVGVFILFMLSSVPFQENFLQNICAVTVGRFTNKDADLLRQYLSGIAPRTMDLIIGFDGEAFETDDGRAPWSDEYSYHDIVNADVIRTLRETPGIRVVSVVEGPCYLVDTPAEEARWASFQSRLNGILQELTFPLPKTPSPTVLPEMFPTAGTASVEPDPEHSTYVSHHSAAISAGENVDVARPGLRDGDIPLTEDAFFILFINRPRDMFAWVQDAKVQKTRLEELLDYY